MNQLEKDPEWVCRPAVLADIFGVCEIHLVAFPGFFLTLLGRRFLRVMYKAFFHNSTSIFVVLDTPHGNLSGFAVGALVKSSSDYRSALKYFPEFIVALVLPVISHPKVVLGRLISKVLKAGSLPQLPPNAVILRSIAVLPSARGSGVAALLLDSFERAVLVKGIAEVYLTTDANNNDRVKRFYSKHGYVVDTRFLQDGNREMLLLKKSLGG